MIEIVRDPDAERGFVERLHALHFAPRSGLPWPLSCAYARLDAWLLAPGRNRQAELAQAVLEGGRSTALRFDESDLAELFAPLR